ncbi:hypothetical protein Bbelb_424540, partial [Branchiostoma belcheri]
DVISVIRVIRVRYSLTFDRDISKETRGDIFGRLMSTLPPKRQNVSPTALKHNGHHTGKVSTGAGTTWRFVRPSNPVIRLQSSAYLLEQMSTKEERLRDYVRGHSKSGHPLSVLEAFDKFSSDLEWTMHVGETKGVVLDQAIRDLQPKVCLELGTYCGYSAIRMARQLRTGGRVIGVEHSQKFADIAKDTVRHAGLGKMVKMIVGSSSQVIPQLKSQHGVSQVDFVFLDHAESLYTTDLKLLERHELLSTGSVILADNVMHPGAPDFLKYVRGSPRYECSFHPATVRTVDGNTVQDGMMKAVYYHRRI